jgi:hypothetical protein
MSSRHNESAQKHCMACAESYSAKVTAVGTVGAGIFAVAANKHWPFFRTRLGHSGKTAVVLMASIACFAASYELELMSCMRGVMHAENEERVARDRADRAAAAAEHAAEKAHTAAMRAGAVPM